MKILYVTAHSPWPVGSGSRIRNWHILDALSRNHEVVVALANSSPNETRKLFSDEGQRWQRCTCRGVRRAFLNRIPGVLFGKHRDALRCKNRNMHWEDFLRCVEEVKPDLIWYFQSQSLWNTGSVPGTRCIYDMDDLESVKRARQLQYAPFGRRITAAMDSFSFHRAERKLMDSVDLVLVSNPQDEAAVARMTKAKVMHLSNGFDFSKAPRIEPRRSNRIIFYGSLGYWPNTEGLLWFCDKMLPMIRNVAPDTELDVAGRCDNSVESVKALPGVSVCGFVPDLDRLAAGAALLAVPLRIGSGTRIKILTAWAMGLPVVSTSIGCEGLGAVDGETILVADSPKQFAEQCLGLLSDPELGARLARQAYEYAKERFDWQKIYAAVDEAVETATR